MKTIEPKEAIKQVQEASEAAMQDTRFIDSMQVGEYVRQGDLYIVRISAVEAKAKETKNRQLAPGGTQGSRHILEGKAKLFNPSGFGTVQRVSVGSQTCLRYVGPQIESKEHVTVTHPEHAHISLPGGCYQVYGQVDWATEQRVLD